MKINSILGGISPLQYYNTENGYLEGLAIDPDFPVEGNKPSGALVPVAYEKFSGANINGNVIAILTNPKNALVYAILSNGKIVSYNSSIASETLVGTVAGSNAEGAIYYNNYIYIFGTGASKNDVSRYGPLNNSPSLVDAVWTGATLGSQTALGDETYPTIRGAGTLPNHWAFVDTYYDCLIFCDFKDGVGRIHRIKTTKTTNEGDTDDGSTYGILTNNLPYGYMPVCMGSWGSDIAIGAIQTSSVALSQGKAAIFFWDGSSESWYRQILLPDPMVSAILSNNGSLYIWSGNFSSGGGYSLYKYIGGDMVSEIASFGEGHPPLQGAVDAIGDKVVWGSWITSPENAAVVWGFGSIDRNLPQSLHCIARSTAVATASDGLITALKFAEQGNKMVLAHRSSTAFGIDKLSTTYQTHYFRKMFNIGREFALKKIQIPLGKAVAANMVITPKIWTDDKSSSKTLRVINNTHFPGKREITLFPEITGKNNFILELCWSGTVNLPILLPIEITLEIYKN